MTQKNLLIFLLLIINGIFNCNGQESCTVNKNNLSGTCKSLRECNSVLDDIRLGKRDYTLCAKQGRVLFVCCPNPTFSQTSSNQNLEQKEIVDNNSTNKTRISQTKCHQYADEVFEKSYTIPLVAGSVPIENKINRCAFKTIPLVVGGTSANPREFPHMALIGFEDDNEISWSCGGTLISERFILTAAHCINTPLGKPKYVRVGALILNSVNENKVDEDPTDFNITDYFIHPNYKRSSKYNDIALLKLSKDVKFNSYKRPACLPIKFETDTRKVIATGWGRTTWAGSRSDFLQKVILDKFSENDCKEIYTQQLSTTLKNGVQYTTQLCAGSKTEQKDTCQGDSGGPIQIFHPTEYCMYQIIGITSFGIMCGTPGIPGVYTRVFSYLDWIEEIVWIYHQNPLYLNQQGPITGPQQSSRLYQTKCHEYQSAVYEASYSISLASFSAKTENRIDKCPVKSIELIVGGTDAKPREFPHMALLGYNENGNILWACGGSLISENFVLTAAHCAKSKSRQPKIIRIGDLNIASNDDISQPEDIKVKEVIIHPDYKTSSKRHDIALIKLEHSIDINTFKRPACLPSSYDWPETRAIATGWGRTDAMNTFGHNHLQKVNIEKFTENECNNIYKQLPERNRVYTISYNSQICAGSRTGINDTCQGDSGGPLQIFHPTEYCMYEIVGITSFGSSCGTPGIPGVYTRVHAYIDWIENIVWK